MEKDKFVALLLIVITVIAIVGYKLIINWIDKVSKNIDGWVTLEGRVKTLESDQLTIKNKLEAMNETHKESLGLQKRVYRSIKRLNVKLRKTDP